MKVKNIIILMRIPAYVAGIFALIWWIEGSKYPHLLQASVWPAIFLIQQIFRKKHPPRVKRTGLMDFSRAEFFSVLTVVVLIGSFFLFPRFSDNNARLLRDGSWEIPVLWAMGSIAGVILTVLGKTIEMEEQERRRKNAEATPAET